MLYGYGIGMFLEFLLKYVNGCLDLVIDFIKLYIDVDEVLIFFGND